MHEANSEKNKNMMSQFMDNFPHRSLVKANDGSWNNEISADHIADYQRSLDYSGHSIDPVEVEQSIYDQVWSEAEILKAEEAAEAGQAFKNAVLELMTNQGALDQKITDMEKGMLTTNLKTEADRKAKEVEAKAKEVEAKRIADAEEKAKISKDVVKDLDEDSGRRKPVKKMENLRGEKPGFVMAEGTNWWSVDEKDDYWQTKEGHKEAMNLYGQKPAWVKESTLEYNPKTGKYDSIKKEEFAEIKPKKRISL
jgi:hypothetical protein